MEFTQEEIELIYDKANSYSTGLLTTAEVQWLKHNDEDALANVLYNYTTGFLRNNPQYYQMIDDVVNTIVFFMWNRIDSYNHTKAGFSTWCYLVIKHCIRNELAALKAVKRGGRAITTSLNRCRKIRTEDTSKEVLDSIDNIGEEMIDVHQCSTTSQPLTEREELIRLIIEDLRDVREGECYLTLLEHKYLLGYLSGMTYRDMEKKYHTNDSTIRRYIQRALQKITKRYFNNI
jgi:RNA polymerase sigma factor (sigma-70 family)